MKLSIAMGAILGLFLSACSPKHDVTAPKDVKDSFKVTTIENSGNKQSAKNHLASIKKDTKDSFGASSFDNSESKLNAENYLVSIKKDSLEKEFLLRAQLIEQSPTPAFNGLRSRIVSFRRQHNKLFMLEASDGHVVTTSIPTILLIAEFKIVSESEQSVTFDFNEGMAQLFTAGAWTGQDFAGKSYQNQFEAVEVLNSFLDEARVSESSNALILRQVAQLQSNKANHTDRSVQALYYLSPYQPSSKFKPYNNESFDSEGYFEVAPVISLKGGTKTYASKFGLSDSITYAISSNTPEEYVDAIKDGILYWNKAFGAEVVKVVMAPEGISAPHPDYNIVQWVNWPGAGFAYADAQADPRTGEILNAQVYLTSTFATLADFSIRRLEKKTDTQALEEHIHQNHKNHRMTLKGFSSDHNCAYDIQQATMRATALLNKNNASEDLILKAVRDQLRQVTAHEVGHTLGLRHNFAGSLAANYKMSDRNKLIRQYIDNKKAPEGIVVTSSMMDYLPTFDDFVAGDQVASLDSAAEYDKVAIQKLYYENDSDTKPLFCTDTHVGAYADCQRHDASSSIIEFAKESSFDELKQIPYYIFSKMVRSAFPKEGTKAVPVNRTPLSSEVYVQSILAPRVSLLTSMFESTNLISIHRQHDIVDEFNIEMVKKQEFDYLLKQITNVGGFSQALFIVPGEIEIVWMALFLEQLRKNSKGVTEEGVEYELSQKQIEQMTERAVLFFTKYKTDLIKMSIAYMAQLQDLPDHAISNELLQYLDMTLKYYVFSAEEQTQTSSISVANLDKNKYAVDLLSTLTPEDSVINFPKFKYDTETRTLAAMLIHSGKAPKAPEWGLKERMLNAQIMESMIKKVMGDVSKKLEKLLPPDETEADEAEGTAEEAEVELTVAEQADVEAPEFDPSEIDKVLSPQLLRWIAENQALMGILNL